MAQERRRLRCAIYTRKSSEEGLEQSFNSLDAQREACAAYIESQRHEGWKAIDARYDDGGFSGGSMDRPALKALLTALEAGQIDVVVVYKVDRLTRSLADFAKIVELFDRHRVSFVSVTQQFNTTTSMGRLTLNVLLSFAQFEREVTGERIRDKIAASKRKGMWMGGFVPLGYNLKDRKLLVNAKEARLVRRIYERYLALGCVRKLRSELISDGVKSKTRTSRGGRKSGGVPYSRGALYDILQNRLYLGEIAHKGAIHPGEHEAIVPRRVWEDVQVRLRSNGQARRMGLNAKSPSLLAGLLFDAAGHRFTPLHSTKDGKRYRYYTSQSVIQDGPDSKHVQARIPAHELEELVTKRLQALLTSHREVLNATARERAPAAVQEELARSAQKLATAVFKNGAAQARHFLCNAVSRIVVRESYVEIAVSRAGLCAVLLGKGPAPGKPIAGDRLLNRPATSDVYTLKIPAQFKRKTGAVRLLVPPSDQKDDARRVNEVLVKALARSRHWCELLTSGKVASLHALAKATGLHERYVGRVLRCAFLGPSIVARVLEGSADKTLTLDRLLRGFPIDWRAQEEVLGRT